METLAFVAICIGIAAFGAWDGAQCRHRNRDNKTVDRK